MFGNLGCYVDDNSVISFQVGASITGQDPFERSSRKEANTLPVIRFLSINGYNVCARGVDNMGCERIEKDIKRNRLFPRLIAKQVNFLYGKGLYSFKDKIVNGKFQRVWEENETITEWLNNWKENGLDASANDTALALIKRFYTYRDYFVRFRFTQGKVIGRYPIAGFDLLENSKCRLATKKMNLITDTVEYSDLRYVLFGPWNRGGANFKVYPLFDIRDIDNYQFAAVSHHKESSVDEFYGLNETYEGTKRFMKTSNDLPSYFDSFLRNSLAAKVHVIIPEEWIESKRKQIKTLCAENKKRAAENKEFIKYNGIDIGDEYSETFLINYMNLELKRLSEYLSGPDNQGKIFSSVSFKTGQDKEAKTWQIKPMDLKYKEYIEALIKLDERVDEVLLSSIGLDSSITAVSKPGMISKSGSDSYYNLIIYLLSLTSDDEKCAEPFNIALKANFPDLYKEGFRIGFYREIPSRQEDISTNDRIQNQQS